ncbi:hypothetical protein XENTR_v10003508 [Xenopus tropicalis]|uniref:Protein spire homolog 1 isoform X2 n=1 Tax=Xenopus tropicalis TaxID=8364 RepID=A0A8J0R3V7_XENTR|nr:protein spire homolog 1 isoform X2 [Xenopus tropicalis]KAE8574618.1 hypothetical protein XENTR_v10003508 [Xenopus tropicalis]|eukprot:XP_004918776.1 PREDICTED: protein spire homolog 1-like isoform X2 [Xenopus tropicalis]
MDENSPPGGCSKVTLKEILQGYGQPISEEQAWALCYQCCTKLKQMLWGAKQVPFVRGVEHIHLHQDGTASFAVSKEQRGARNGSQDINQAERKIIEHLGQVIYTALDWGLTSDMERVLSEPLDKLLYSMLGLHAVAIDYSLHFQCPIMLKDIIKQCADRLFTPSEAYIHYRAVCQVLFAEHKEFCNLLLTIERSKQSLRKLEAEDILDKDAIILYDNWGNLWSNVIKELRLGIRLRNSKDRSYVGLPAEYELTPYELLMNDIRAKRYTLREVKESQKRKMSESVENFIMDFIRLQPLRPASERKLKEKSQEEPSLHELLMTEIKSGKKLRATRRRKRNCLQDDDSLSSQSFSQSDDSLSPLDYRMSCSRSTPQASDLGSNESDVKISWQSDFSSENSSDSKFSDLTSSSTDLMFVPVLTSSQVDLKNSSFLNADMLKYSSHKRSSSYESPLQKKYTDHNCRYPKIRPIPTIAELVPTRRDIVKAEMADFLQNYGFSGSRICFCCHKKRLFFTWPYTCKICERVICPECCVEMLMPFKQCMHLPLSFFKTLVLTRDDDPSCQEQRTQLFCRETLQWDCSSVPLVFEPQDLSDNIPFHKRTMKNWTCMDICTKCEDFILDTVDLSHPSNVTSNGLKSRCLSQS